MDCQSVHDAQAVNTVVKRDRIIVRSADALEDGTSSEGRRALAASEIIVEKERVATVQSSHCRRQA